MLCSDAPSVQPVLKTWFLSAWHCLWTIVCWMHRCLSLTRRLNRCYWVFLTWLSTHFQLHRCRGVGSSDNHRIHWWCTVGLTGAANPALLRPICRGDHLDAWNIFYLTLAPLRLIGLVILMVDWTWRLDDRLDIASWRWIRHVQSYPWDLKTPTNVISQTC